MGNTQPNRSHPCKEFSLLQLLQVNLWETHNTISQNPRRWQDEESTELGKTHQGQAY